MDDTTEPPDRPDILTTQELPAEETPQRWSASAAVPVPEVEPIDDPLTEYEERVPPEAARNWLTPLLFGLIGFLLLTVLLGGLWLIYRAGSTGTPAEPTASTAPAQATAPATGPAPTQAAPTAAPSTKTASTVPRSTAATRPAQDPPPTGSGAVVPPLVGLAEDEARQRLTDAGLRFEVVRQPDGTVLPGTVLSASPAPGSTVAPNSVIRLVVASAP